MKKIVIALCIVMLSACSGSMQLETLPDKVDQVSQDINAGAAKALGLLLAAAEFADAISEIEHTASLECATPATATQPGTGCVVPPNVDNAFDALMLGYVKVSREAVSRIRAGVKSWADLRSILNPVMTEVQRLTDYVQSVGALKTRLGNFAEKLKVVVNQAVGREVFGTNTAAIFGREFGGAL